MEKKAQIAIEFLLLLGISLAIIMILLLSFLVVSKTNVKIHNYNDLEDLGQSLQQEFFLATELEDGYTRKINLPMSLGDKSLTSYTVSIMHSNNVSKNYTYLVLSYDTQETFYAIPYTYGAIHLGDNTLVKNNGSLRIN